MSVEVPLLALRDSKGIKFCHAPPQKGEYEKFSREENPCCRDMTFAKDGSFFAWCTNQRTSVGKSPSYKPVCKIENSRIFAIHLSPKGTYLSTWEPYIAKQTVQDSCNLHIWNVESDECVKSFIQKKQFSWNPQWSDDEFICARNVNNEVHIFENAKFDKISKKIFMQKVARFNLAPGEPPYHLVCFVPGTKGQPSFVRLFKYPNFEGSNAVIAQKSFFKAERTDFFWNKTGKDCIFITSVDVDKSGASYYGELNIYYISVKGETSKIMLGKDGPVYSVKWCPSNTEFCVVYGYMPAKATIFNLKCESIFDFGSGPRNEVNYSPVGDRLSLSGFGNLQGQIEVWDLKTRKQICKFVARDSTLIQWSYDGEYILTATTSPRLRIGNGYRIWHYTGSLLEEIFCPTNEELFDIMWKPVPEGSYKPKQTTFTPVPGIGSATPAASTQVYRPPAAQGRAASFKLHEEEKPASDTNQPMSKYKKKRLNRKAKQELEKQEDNAEKPEVNSPAVKNETIAIKLTGDPEIDKKIRNLRKKIGQIEKLKRDQAAGKVLEISQVEKIKKAPEIEAELARLQLN